MGQRSVVAMGRGEGRGAAKGGGKGWGKGWGKAMGWGKGSGKGKGEAKGGADGPAKDQNVLAADDFGRAYTDEEKVSFATLIMYQELTNVEYGHFKNLRAWPGIVGSVLLELQRAARRQNPPNDMVMHKVFHIGEDVTAHMTKKQLKNIHDDATEARLCELAWEWPFRRETSEVRLKAAMEVPPLLNVNLVDEFRLGNKMERNMAARQLRVRTEARPPPKNGEGLDYPLGPAVMEYLVPLAFVEYKFCADPDRVLLAVMLRAAVAMDRSSADAQAAAAYAARYVSDWQFAARNGAAKAPAWTPDDAATMRKHLEFLKSGAAPGGARAKARRDALRRKQRAKPKKIASGQRRVLMGKQYATILPNDAGEAREEAVDVDWDPAAVARRGAAAALGVLLEHGDVVAQVCACAALADACRFLNGACDLGAPNAKHLVALVRSNATEGRRHRVVRPTCELVPILACVAVAAVVLQAPDDTRGALVDAGAVEALVDALRANVDGGKTQGGNVTPSAMLLPRHAVSALCYLCDDAATRARARAAGAADVVSRLAGPPPQGRGSITVSRAPARALCAFSRRFRGWIALPAPLRVYRPARASGGGRRRR